METINIKDYDELKNFFRMKTDSFPILAYLVFKKYYKERAYELNFEILLQNQVTVLSLIRAKIDESDFKKMKFRLNQITAKEVKDLNKKAIIYQYMFEDETALKKLYQICESSLHDVQFSDFFDA